MSSRTSQLIVELLDRVSGPARAAAGSLGRLRGAAEAGGGMGDRLNTALARTNERLEVARGGLIEAAGAFYTLRSAVGAPVRAAMALESAMADVRKVVNFTDDADAASFTAELVALTETIPMAVEGLAQIAAAAGQAGIAREDLIAFTETAAKVGVAFDISADQAGEAMAKMMTGLGLTLEEVLSLSNAMNHLSNAQASSAAEILEVVRRAGAMGVQFGFTAEQTAAFGSAMIASGATADVASTSFLNMGRALTRGASATARQRGAFQQLGLDATEVARRMQEDAVGTTIDVMERIAALPAELRAAVSSDLFGDEARALGPLLTQMDLVRESVGLVADQAAYAGSAFAEFEVRAKTFQNRLTLFQNALARVGIVIGTALLPPLTTLMNTIQPVIDRIGAWIAMNPGLTASVLGATAAVVAFRGAVAALRFVGLLGAGGALSLLAAGMNTVGAAALRLGGAAKAAIALQTALGAMSGGGALSTLSKLGIGLRAALVAVPGMGALGSAIAAIGAAVATISAPVWGAFAVAAAAIGAVGAVIWKNWDRITATLGGVAQAIGEILAPAIEAVRPALEWLAPVGEAIAAGWDRAKAVLASVGEWLGSVFQRDVLSPEDEAAAHDAGYRFVMSLWDGMKQVMTDLLAWISTKASEILAPFAGLGERIRSFLPGGTVTASENPASEFAGFEARAGGGPVRAGRPYLVGEEGPELITPRSDGFVHTAAETQAMMGGGSSRPASGGRAAAPRVTVNVNVAPAPGLDEEALANRVARKIEGAVANAMRAVQADVGSEAYG